MHRLVSWKWRCINDVISHLTLGVYLVSLDATRYTHRHAQSLTFGNPPIQFAQWSLETLLASLILFVTSVLNK